MAIHNEEELRGAYARLDAWWERLDGLLRRMDWGGQYKRLADEIREHVTDLADECQHLLEDVKRLSNEPRIRVKEEAYKRRIQELVEERNRLQERVRELEGKESWEADHDRTETSEPS